MHGAVGSFGIIRIFFPSSPLMAQETHLTKLVECFDMRLMLSQKLMNLLDKGIRQWTLLSHKVLDTVKGFFVVADHGYHFSRGTIRSAMRN